jgi:dimethylglycine dehydrogenase
MGAKISASARPPACRENGEWIVHTQGRHPLRISWSTRRATTRSASARWFKPYGGRTVPMMVMSHQYMLLTEEMPEVRPGPGTGGKLPLLRDVDSSYYLRQEKNGFNLGPYERNCKAHWVTPDDPMPEDFSFQLYPDDLERLEWYIEDAMERVPLLAKRGYPRSSTARSPTRPTATR